MRLSEGLSQHMVDFIASVPPPGTPAHEDMKCQALARGADLRDRFSLSAEDLGAIATLWAAEAAIAFSKHIDSAEDKGACITALEDSFLLVQTAVLVARKFDEVAAIRALTFATLQGTLNIAPTTTEAQPR